MSGTWQHAPHSPGITERDLEKKRQELQRKLTPAQIDDMHKRQMMEHLGLIPERPRDPETGRRKPGRPPSTRTCSDPTCGRKHYANGLCEMHNRRQYRARRKEADAAP